MDGVSRTSGGGDFKSQNLDASVKDAFCCGRPKREQAPVAGHEHSSEVDLWIAHLRNHCGRSSRHNINDFKGVISALREKNCLEFKEGLERLNDSQISKFSKYMSVDNAWAQSALNQMLMYDPNQKHWF